MGETKLLTEIFFRKSKYEVHGYKIILCLKILGVFNFNGKKIEWNGKVDLELHLGKVDHIQHINNEKIFLFHTKMTTCGKKLHSQMFVLFGIKLSLI